MTWKRVFFFFFFCRYYLHDHILVRGIRSFILEHNSWQFVFCEFTYTCRPFQIEKLLSYAKRFCFQMSKCNPVCHIWKSVNQVWQFRLQSSKPKCLVQCYLKSLFWYGTSAVLSGIVTFAVVRINKASGTVSFDSFATGQFKPNISGALVIWSFQ